MVKALLRYFSCAFHGLLSLYLFAVSCLALFTDPQSLRLDVLPWTGPTLTRVVFYASLVGLLAVILALFRKLSVLLLLWSLAVAVMLIKGYVLGPYAFDPGGLSTALLLIAGSLIAIVGSWFQMRQPKQ